MDLPQDIAANRSSAPVQRAHLLLPVFDDDGQVVKEVTVTLLDDQGNTVTPEAWTGPLADFDQPLDWPVSFRTGVIDLWLTAPGRFDLRAENKNRMFSKLYAGVDVRVGADLELMADQRLGVNGAPEPGTWLQIAADGSAHWVTPPLIAPHNHSGAQSGSTVLTDGSQTDASPDQTWLGYQAGQDATGSDTTVIGGSEPGIQTVTLGTNSISVNARRSVLLGGDSISVSQGSVLLGDNLSAASGTEVMVEEDSVGQQSFALTAYTTTLRPAFALTAATMSFGSSLSASVPNGVAAPIMFQHTQVLVPGTLRTMGRSQMAGPGGVLSFFGAAGTTKQTIDPTSATDALGSLLNALRSYNLV